MEIFKEFTFDAAHRLPNVPAGHKCAQLHGHTFRAEIRIRGPVHPTLGWVMDFGDLKRVAAPVIERLDHSYLNEIPGLENPTSENIARWLWRELKPQLPMLASITLRETGTSGCVYDGLDA